MILTTAEARGLRGTVEVPGDKSITHRALMLGALADGETEVRGCSRGEDCLATAGALAALGAEVEGWDRPLLRIRGRGLRGLSEPPDVLDARNSGTTIRLLSGILAGQRFFSVLTGDASLRRRPMGRVVEPLRRMGANIAGREGGRLPPLAIQGGPLRGAAIATTVASAQVKSAILLAGLLATGPTEVREPELSRDHTERMLPAFGVPVARDGCCVRLEPPSRLRATAIQVPGDFSAAAFLIVAALITPGSEVCLRRVGVNPTRTGLLDVLRAMGADVSLANPADEGGEPVADLVVRSSSLRGVEVGGGLLPRLIDEVPALAVAACHAAGRTVIRDAAELRVKEVDRIAALAEELSRLGARVSEREDGLIIEGGAPLRGTACRSRGDHRMAMALAVAGLGARGSTEVGGAEAAAVSFPGFAEALGRLAPDAVRWDGGP